MRIAAHALGWTVILAFTSLMVVDAQHARECAARGGIWTRATCMETKQLPSVRRPA